MASRQAWNSVSGQNPRQETPKRPVVQTTHLDALEPLPGTSTDGPRERRSDGKTAILLCTKYRYTRCYLIPSVSVKKAFGHFGNQHFIKNSNDFSIECTMGRQAIKQKITVSADKQQDLSMIVRRLIKLYGRSLESINPVHCPICYSEAHMKMQCKSCAYCFKPNHLLAACPDMPSISVNTAVAGSPTGSTKSQKVRQYRKRKLDELGDIGLPAFRDAGAPKDIYLQKIVPIGDPKMPTFGLDVEGAVADKQNVAASVCLASYYGGAIGFKRTYYAYILSTEITKVNDRITGISHQDIEYGETQAQVKATILRYLHKARVVTLMNDFKMLGINSEELIKNETEHVDLAVILRDRLGPIGLSNLLSIFNPNERREPKDFPSKPGITGGHSAERDAKNTLRIYKRWSELKKQGIYLTGTILRMILKDGNTVDGYVKSLNKSAESKH